MTAVFYSDITSHLKVNGEYLGVVSKNAKIVEIYDDCLIEFIPLNNEYYPIISSLKNACCVKVFNLLGDLIIIPVYEKKRNLPYNLIFQKSFSVYNNSLIITVIQDGFYKFYIDGCLTYISELPFYCSECEVKEIQNILFIIFKGKKQVVFAFDLSTGKLVFKSLANSTTFNEFLTITNFYSTAIPVNVIERWDISNFSLIDRCAKPIKTQYDIHPKLVSVCFFEFIALSVDTSFLLSENIKSREKELHGFIGKPIVIFPYYKDLKKTVVVLNDSVHLYNLEYKNGLIDNILEE